MLSKLLERDVDLRPRVFRLCRRRNFGGAAASSSSSLFGSTKMTGTGLSAAEQLDLVLLGGASFWDFLCGFDCEPLLLLRIPPPPWLLERRFNGRALE